MGVVKCGGAHVQRDCDARKNTGKQSSGKGNQSKSWSKSEGKGESKENKGKSKGTKVAKGSHKGKTSKTCLSGLENSKAEASSDSQESAQTCPTDTYRFHDGWNVTNETMVGVSMNGMMAVVLMNEMMTGVLLDGTKVGNKRMTLPQAHLHLEVWMLVPPVESEAVRMGEDEPRHRSCSEHIPIELCSRRNRRWKILSDAMKTDCSDL